MKGFVFTVGDTEDLSGEEVADTMVSRLQAGCFSVRMIAYNSAMMATLADFMTMRPGDKVFFFAKRCLYGIGTIVGSGQESPVVYENYPGSLAWPWPESTPPGTMPSCGLIPNPHERVIVVFEPGPVTYRVGLDMDDVLSARGSENALGLRFMHQRSFHQLTHDETRWLCELFQRRLGRLGLAAAENSELTKRRVALHARLAAAKMKRISMTEIVDLGGTKFADGHGGLKQEFTLHALVAEQLGRTPPDHSLSLPTGITPLDSFHELWASPSKPPIYADKIDLMLTGQLLPPYSDPGVRLPAFFDLYELKKDEMSIGELESLLLQGMKYVDFVAATFGSNDYGTIRLNLLCKGYPEGYQDLVAAICRRQYIFGFRSSLGDPNRVWSAVRLLEYSWDVGGGALSISPRYVA